MNTLHWKLFEKYKEQQKTRKELREKKRRERDEAWEHLQKTADKYEEMLYREFQGDDVTEEKKDAKEKADEAREIFESALEKQRNGDDQEDTETITSKDLISDWNENILPSVKDKQMKSVLDKMNAARYSYCEALKDYYLLNNESREKLDEVSRLEFARAMENGDFQDIKQLSQEDELPLIRQHHLDHIAYEYKLPKEFEEE